MKTASEKLNGCCTKCDKEVFEIVTRNPDTREPIRVGKPLENAMRLTFILADGSKMDLTFCAECARGLLPDEFSFLWRRVLRSWVAESGADHPFVKTQGSNAILALANQRRWLEVS